MSAIDTFWTTRLVAERLRDEDFDELCLMHRDPRVMATLGGVRTDALTRDFLRDSLEHWDRHGFGLWVFRDPETREFIGRGGLRRVEVGGDTEEEVAYALMAEAWGKGLATEMARAMVEVGFDLLGMTDLVAFTLTTNRASANVMEKVGFLFEREIVHAGLPHVLYRLVVSTPRDADTSE